MADTTTTMRETAERAVIDTVLSINVLWADALNRGFSPTMDDLYDYTRKGIERMDPELVAAAREAILEVNPDASGRDVLFDEFLRCVSAVKVEGPDSFCWYPSAAAAARDLLNHLPRLESKKALAEARAACVDWQGDMMREHAAQTEICGRRYAVTWERAMERLDRNEPKERDGLVGAGVGFQRIRRITGYLVGALERFNDGKSKEERDRVKHSLAGMDDDIPRFGM